MRNATEEFFDELGRRGHEPSLAMTSGMVRCDLTHDEHTDHWSIKIENGDIVVLHEDVRADAVLMLDRALFDGIASGEVNLTAAFFRGTVAIQGDFELICLFERLLSPPSMARERSAAGGGRREP